MEADSVFDIVAGRSTQPAKVRSIARSFAACGVTVSTVLDDGIYETAIIDILGAHPVERYEFLWQAEAGHERWLKFADDCGFKRVTRLGSDDGLVMPVEIMLLPPTMPPWPFEDEDEEDE